jgi:hypothetical protein
MPGFESAECKDHDERNARRLTSVKIRATQIVAAAWALQLAGVVYKFARAVGTEAERVHCWLRCFTQFGLRRRGWLNHFQKVPRSMTVGKR